MPHIGFSSAVDYAPELAFAVLGRAKPPARQLSRKAAEDLAVGQSLALQRAMAPADELLRAFVEKRQHLVDEPARLGAVQPRRANQIDNEVLELAQLRHDGRIPRSTRRARTLPEVGQNSSIFPIRFGYSRH